LEGSLRRARPLEAVFSRGSVGSTAEAKLVCALREQQAAIFWDKVDLYLQQVTEYLQGGRPAVPADPGTGLPGKAAARETQPWMKRRGEGTRATARLTAREGWSASHPGRVRLSVGRQLDERRREGGSCGVRPGAPR
jgi:hypothetical protein